MYRYELVADLIKERISSGVLNAGDQLPSVRQLALETGYSVVTIHRAYEILESDGTCVARQRSGFYVADNPASRRRVASQVSSIATPIRVTISDTVMLYWEKRHGSAFGSILPSRDLFQRDLVDRALRQVLRRQPDKISAYEMPEGDPLLRQMLSKRLASRGISAEPAEIVITRSGSSGFNICLDAITKPGDTVLVESPTYLPMLLGLKRRHLLAVELPSHPLYGVDPDQFRHLIATTSIKVCLLVAANHYPTGVSYPRENMRKIVEIARNAGVIIIENDMFGELSYGAPSASLREFDNGNTVLQFGSFANILSPEYGLGWVLSGKSTQAILAVQYAHGLQGKDGSTQRAIGEFLQSHSQERHLRRIRQKLGARMGQAMELISRHFPESCVVSRPTGGFMCWVRGPDNFDSLVPLSSKSAEGYSYLPGSLFTVSSASTNYIALNCSFEWTPVLTERLISLGQLLKA